ncbi:uncharacterized protein HfgLR_13140 [Haloferax gibbonsii]|uniref:Uncharacterized protein n=1 Tax=Haloferax gibbonsii TaxID=35746 RepID=A0A871BIX9_HALGI|nr:uncharacterized protein HfgLR_13140 [Haloferax gibbonsii]
MEFPSGQVASYTPLFQRKYIILVLFDSKRHYNSTNTSLV